MHAAVADDILQSRKLPLPLAMVKIEERLERVHADVFDGFPFAPNPGGRVASGHNWPSLNRAYARLAYISSLSQALEYALAWQAAPAGTAQPPVPVDVTTEEPYVTRVETLPGGGERLVIGLGSAASATVVVPAPAHELAALGLTGDTHYGFAVTRGVPTQPAPEDGSQPAATPAP